MPQTRRWLFTDPEDNSTVVLAEDFLAIEARRYDCFENFLDRLQEALAAFLQCFHRPIVTRVGLRYVNEIRPGHTDWSSVIRPELLGPLSVKELVGNTLEVIATQQLELHYSGNRGINISHGLAHGGTTVRPRDGEVPPDTPFYLLDFDAYKTFLSKEGQPMDAAKIGDYVNAFNKVIYRVFRWATTEEYILTLGGRQGDGSNIP